jgi:hypothetical protein
MARQQYIIVTARGKQTSCAVVVVAVAVAVVAVVVVVVGPILHLLRDVVPVHSCLRHPSL